MGSLLLGSITGITTFVLLFIVGLPETLRTAIKQTPSRARQTSAYLPMTVAVLTVMMGTVYRFTLPADPLSRP